MSNQNAIEAARPTDNTNHRANAGAERIIHENNYSSTGAPWNQRDIQAQHIANARAVLNPSTGEMNMDHNGALSGNGPGALYRNDVQYSLNVTPKNMSQSDYVSQMWQEHPDQAYAMMLNPVKGAYKSDANADQQAAKQALDDINHPKKGQFNNLAYNVDDASGDPSTSDSPPRPAPTQAADSSPDMNNMA